MPATLILQSTAPFTNAFGGAEGIGPITFTGTATPMRTFVTLQSGNNTIAVPTPAAGTFIGVIITPPAVGGIVLKYKTTIGDVGVAIPQGTPTMFLFDSNNIPANIYINAASLTASPTQIEFF